MGLSNEERSAKIVWAINALTKLGRELRGMAEAEVEWGSPQYVDYNAESHLRHLADLTDQLWHAYLGTKSNSGFWLLGGDSTNPIRTTETPWQVALENQFRLNRREDGFVYSNRSKEFNPFDGYLDLHGLLGRGWHQKVYDLYTWCGQLSYALRRYEDSFLRQFPDLNKLISDMQGECFALFEDKRFAKAYVGERIFKAIYGGTYIKEGSLGEVLVKVNMHHKFSRLMHREVTLAEVIDWDQYLLRNKKTPTVLLTLALRIAGRKFDHDHSFKKLLTELAAHEIEVDETVLSMEFEKCKAAKAGYKETSGRNYSEEWERDELYALHGFPSSDWSEDDAWDGLRPDEDSEEFDDGEEDTEDVDTAEGEESEGSEDTGEALLNLYGELWSWLGAKIRDKIRR